MKNKKRLIILISVLAVVLLAYFFLTKKSGDRFQWNESYKGVSNQPYGTLFLKRLLEEHKEDFLINDKKPLKFLLASQELKDSTDYVFIGPSLYLDSGDRKQLIRFIEAGNDAFIASLELPEILYTDIDLGRCEEDIGYTFDEVDSVRLNFFNDTIAQTIGYLYRYRYGATDRKYSWSYVDESFFCDEQEAAFPVGYHSNNKVNFIRIPMGAGNLYIHTNPLVFTNYFLINEDKLKYASTVFSHLRGRHIVWDEFSKVPYIYNNNPNESPLYYILSQPSLKYAWWLLLFTVLLYVLFAAKRTQRVIPVLEAKSNTSLEFVKMISALHYQNKNHLDMARKKMKYFLFFIRSKYAIHVQQFTDDHIERLAQKSGVAMNDIKTIFNLYYSIDHATTYAISEYQLTNFYDAIDSFYKHCK